MSSRTSLALLVILVLAIVAVGMSKPSESQSTATSADADVITMNSRFALRNEHAGKSASYTVVYPEDEALHLGRMSVLSPMGMATYGARVGDEICWMSAAGPEVATVQRLIDQPEAAGHHHR